MGARASGPLMLFWTASFQLAHDHERAGGPRSRYPTTRPIVRAV